MADDIDRDATRERADEPPPRRRKRWGLRLLAILVLLPLVAIGLWIAFALNYTYSTGDRAGYVQKFSKKGWLCKTWEGELAMVSIPGTTPERFPFTVRNESVARELARLIGERVAITYEQHVGIPTTCFGETQYYVSAVRQVGGFGSPTPEATAHPQVPPGTYQTPAPTSPAPATPPTPTPPR